MWRWAVRGKRRMRSPSEARLCAVGAGEGAPLRELSPRLAESLLPRENRSVRLAGSLPSVGPVAVGEVEAGLAVGVVEGFVHGERAG